MIILSYSYQNVYILIFADFRVMLKLFRTYLFQPVFSDASDYYNAQLGK